MVLIIFLHFIMVSEEKSVFFIQRGSFLKRGLYKYIFNGDIIYIGMSQVDIGARILCHSKESKFLPYLDNCEIYYTEVFDPEEIPLLETVLIKKYKPKLNVKDNNNESIRFKVPSTPLDWVKWEPEYLLSDNAIDIKINSLRNVVRQIEDFSKYNSMSVGEMERVLEMANGLYVSHQTPAYVITTKDKIMKCDNVKFLIDGVISITSMKIGRIAMNERSVFCWKLDDSDLLKENLRKVSELQQSMDSYKSSVNSEIVALENVRDM